MDVYEFTICHNVLYPIKFNLTSLLIHITIAWLLRTKYILSRTILIILAAVNEFWKIHIITDAVHFPSYVLQVLFELRRYRFVQFIDCVLQLTWTRQKSVRFLLFTYNHNKNACGEILSYIALLNILRGLSFKVILKFYQR